MHEYIGARMFRPRTVGLRTIGPQTVGPRTVSPWTIGQRTFSLMDISFNGRFVPRQREREKKRK